MEYVKLFGLFLLTFAAFILYDLTKQHIEMRRLRDEVVQPFPPTPELIEHSVRIINTVSGAATAAILDTLPVRVFYGSNSSLPYFAFPTFLSPTQTTDRHKLEVSLTNLIINCILLPSNRSSFGFLYDWKEQQPGLYALEIRYAITWKENETLRKTLEFEQNYNLRNTLAKVNNAVIDPDLEDELKKCR